MSAARRPRAGRARAAQDPVRSLAADVLRAVDEGEAYANLVLPGALRAAGVAGRDAALATELVYGTLRRQGSLDAVIDACAVRSAPQPAVRRLLRLGCYQLLHTRVPPHAAVSTTVELGRQAFGERVVGYLNGVLRAVARADWPAWLDRLAPEPGMTRTALDVGAPEWVVAAFADALGGDLAQAALALAPDRPEVHLAARPGRVTREELLAEAGPEATAGPWSPYAVHLAHGAPGALASVRSGRAGVQDEGSQLAALAVARVPAPPGRGWWLDLCAAPGGKAALLAAAAAAGGERLLAADRSVHRARLLDHALAGTGRTVVADGTAPAWRPGAFSRVLLDAPCSGLGALRRRPELRWRRTPADVSRLAGLQRTLLSRALDAAAPGGAVVYVTCSPHLAETRLVVGDVVASRPDVVAEDAAALFPELPDAGPAPYLQLWPHRHGTDAMFVAVLRRVH